MAKPQETIIRNLTRYCAQDITTATVFAAAEQGDPVASEIVRRAGEMLGFGFATLVSLLEPEKIIVGGGMADVGELDPAANSSCYGRTLLPYLQRLHFGRYRSSGIGGQCWDDRRCQYGPEAKNQLGIHGRLQKTHNGVFEIG